MKEEKEESFELFHRMSENVDNLLNLSNHMRDCNTITQEFVEKLKSMSHDERLKLIKESNNPHMYQMSIWYQKYGKLTNMNQLTDKNLYFEYYLDLYITLYCVIILRILDIDNELKEEKYDLEYYKRFIRQTKSTEQIKIVPFIPRNDLVCMDYFMEKMGIQHNMLPVYAVKYNGKIYFKYKSELENMLNETLKWGYSWSTGRLTLFNEKQYYLSKSVMDTLTYLVKKMIIENHSDHVERTKNVKKSNLFIYPIYILEDKLFRELTKNVNNKKEEEYQMINKLENLKI